MSFARLNLHSDIYKALSACGYTKPTPVQEQSIPGILEGKDSVVSAQTGTGKTAAFVLPALHRLSSQPASKKTRILILTPTRELATQITKAANTYGKFMRFNIISLVGGMSYHHQIKDLERGADIIVATPGRLMDHIEQKRVNLSNIEMLVLDEADRMLDMGFIDDVQYIAKLTPAKRQTLLFSATVDKKLMTVVRDLLKNPVRIDLSDKVIASPQIKQEVYRTTNAHHKNRLLKHFLNDVNIYKAIIFSATKMNADKLATQLRDQGFAASALHGDLKQNVRNRTLEQLRRGKIQFLIATDVAARGIDISDITHVINYDLPRFCEDYVHRIGRTGRAGKEGIAISFVGPTDKRHLQNIERYIGYRLQIMHDIDTSGEPERAVRPIANDAFDDERPRRSHHERRGDRGDNKRFSDRKSSSNGFKRNERKEGTNRFERSERKEGASRFERSERKPAAGRRFERSERKEDSSRFERSERKESASRFERSERKPAIGRRFERAERKEGAANRFERNDRKSYSRFEKADRKESGKRFAKNDRYDRAAPQESSERPKKKFGSTAKKNVWVSNKNSPSKPFKAGARPFKKRSVESSRGKRSDRAAS